MLKICCSFFKNLRLNIEVWLTKRWGGTTLVPLRSDIYTICGMGPHHLSNLISLEGMHHPCHTSMQAAWATRTQFLSTRYPSLLGKQSQYEMRSLPQKIHTTTSGNRTPDLLFFESNTLSTWSHASTERWRVSLKLFMWEIDWAWNKMTRITAIHSEEWGEALWNSSVNKCR